MMRDQQPKQQGKHQAGYFQGNKLKTKVKLTLPSSFMNFGLLEKLLLISIE